MKNYFLDIQKNSFLFNHELQWLDNLISFRLNNYFKVKIKNVLNLAAPNLNKFSGKYADWLKKNKFSVAERLIITCCLANNYYPKIYDKFLIKNKGIDKRFTEFGGRIDEKNSKFIPSLETISFILYGKNMESKFRLQSIFEEDHIFNKQGILQYESDMESNTIMSKTFYLNDEILHLLTTGKNFKPNLSINFPAKLLKSELEWEDLILSPLLIDEIENINTWIKHRNEIENNLILRKKLSKGYKCLFYGPPGTGKTLTTCLLGKINNKDVYRVDLSQIVSKYVGETEKNLSKIFNLAENKDWILFFDEAESLFSKRTTVTDSKDKFANQQTAYLLQRMEDYNGLIILATNLKPNIDNAFSRRIQSVLNFTIPDFTERKILWKNALNGISNINEKQVHSIAREYEITGGSIKNIIQYSWLLSKRNNQKNVSKKELLQGIKRELNKDGKSI